MGRGLYFAVFAAGAVIGSAVTWRCLKKKYERIAQEEIDSVKEIFAKRNQEKAEEPRQKVEPEQAETEIEIEPDHMEEHRAEMEDYAALLKKLGYTSSEENMTVSPYVISPDEYGGKGYGEISLTYYADGVLVDDDDDMIVDVDNVVGSDALRLFGEYEDDSVFIRNDERRLDYEILLDYRTYEEATSEKPRPVEVR